MRGLFGSYAAFPYPLQALFHLTTLPVKLGTSSVIVAAFIGPGTVLTCASAGVNFGYELGWVLLFATVAVFVLQSFTAGTGILVGKGLGEAFRDQATSSLARIVTFGLVVLGLWIGCASFELGNLLGAASGLQAVLGWNVDTRWFVVGLGLMAGLLLILNIRRLTQVLAVLVGLMSLLFLVTLMIAPVDWGAAVKGLVVPTIPSGSLVTLMALIGTTIVTYNLFLHPSVAKHYWQDASDARAAWRHELKGMAVFLPLGGLISFAILASGATLSASGASINDVGSFATLLEPVAGSAARYFFGFGLLAAGLTSAVTAPLAAAAGIRELFGWPESLSDWRYRAVWASVLVAGMLFGLTGLSPLNMIIAAQAANGLLLPIIAGFVLYLTVRQQAVSLPRWYVALGMLITVFCAGLGVRTLLWVWGQVFG